MIQLHNQDCLVVLAELPDNSVDAVVTDPPYGMSQHSQQDIVAALTAWLADEEYVHGKAGFMNKTWDSFVPSPAVWREVLRVLKPGGHILCAASSRTSDLMGISLRLAGFEIRDTIEWIYGSGFPKSLNISKAIDKAAGVKFAAKPASGVGFMNPNNDGYNTALNQMIQIGQSTESAKQWEGFGTALKPAHEPFILARKPIEKGLTIAENCLKWGTGGLDIDGSRIETNGEYLGERNHIGDPHGFINKRQSLRDDNYQQHAQGRFPANVIHDGSECILKLFPAVCGSIASFRGERTSKGTHKGWARESHKGHDSFRGYNESAGSAARFFYCAKASQSERNAGLAEFDAHKNDCGTPKKNIHPTVKPLALMRYLVKLITPPNGVVLDPFMGSGSTGIAAKNLGCGFIGIELDEEYFKIAKVRIERALAI